MWTITKDFAGCYGHRVWTQELDGELSLNAPCKCRHLHGHEALIKVSLTGDKLVNDMVFDFVNLAFVKKFVDDVVDHKFIIDVHDPLLSKLFPLALDSMNWNDEARYGVPDVSRLFRLSGAEYEMYDGLVLVDFVPTSENLAKWMYDYVQAKLEPHGVKVASVTWYETPKSSAVYAR